MSPDDALLMRLTLMPLAWRVVVFDLVVIVVLIAALELDVVRVRLAVLRAVFSKRLPCAGLGGKSHAVE